MTALSTSRPVTRETATVYRGRPLIVSLRPAYMMLREKGRRSGVTLDYRAALDLAFNLLAREKRAERKSR
jgi:hypothetical protein